MPISPARHDLLARLHPFPEPIQLAIPWDTTKKRGVRTKQKIAAWDHHYLLKLLDI